LTPCPHALRRSVDLADVCHSHHIPLIVDEAHGAHLAFHTDFPATSLSQGADLVIQSTHKMLSGLTQSAMLHAQGQRVPHTRISRALQMLQVGVVWGSLKGRACCTCLLRRLHCSLSVATVKLWSYVCCV
jgi:glycine/serine hydroxymethyltransferase